MKRLIESIKKSLEQDNYYSAFFIALALPDICGKITFDGRSKERYTKWCDAFFVDKYTIDMNGVKIYPYKGILTSLDIYALRCSMLHEGKDYVGGQPAHKMIEKFLFCVAYFGYMRTVIPATSGQRFGNIRTA